MIREAVKSAVKEGLRWNSIGAIGSNGSNVPTSISSNEVHLIRHFKSTSKDSEHIVFTLIVIVN